MILLRIPVPAVGVLTHHLYICFPALFFALFAADVNPVADLRFRLWQVCRLVVMLRFDGVGVSLLKLDIRVSFVCTHEDSQNSKKVEHN